MILPIDQLWYSSTTTHQVLLQVSPLMQICVSFTSPNDMRANERILEQLQGSNRSTSIPTSYNHTCTWKEKNSVNGQEEEQEPGLGFTTWLGERAILLQIAVSIADLNSTPSPPLSPLSRLPRSLPHKTTGVESCKISLSTKKIGRRRRPTTRRVQPRAPLSWSTDNWAALSTGLRLAHDDRARKHSSAGRSREKSMQCDPLSLPRLSSELPTMAASLLPSLLSLKFTSSASGRREQTEQKQVVRHLNPHFPAPLFDLVQVRLMEFCQELRWAEVEGGGEAAGDTKAGAAAVHMNGEEHGDRAGTGDPGRPRRHSRWSPTTSGAAGTRGRSSKSKITDRQSTSGSRAASRILSSMQKNLELVTVEVFLYKRRT